MTDMKKALALLALVPPAVIWRGFVLTKLWGWFVVPLFGAPALTIAYAAGLSVLVSMLTMPTRKGEQEWGFVETIGILFLTPALILLFSWIVTFFI